MIGVLAYHEPHRKTYDVLTLLKTCGYTDVFVIGQDCSYTKRHKPLLAHRPPVLHPITTKQICRAFDWPYEHVTRLEGPRWDARTTVLIAGASLLPPAVLEPGARVLNSHPGYLPVIRGLDALKWALYLDQPIAVTTHYITPAVDDGPIIRRQLLTIGADDTFSVLAQRQYNLEVRMLIEAIDQCPLDPQPARQETHPIRRRMDPHTELALIGQLRERRLLP